MKALKGFLLISTLMIASCGDNSPFDEDYWEDPGVTDRDVNEQTTEEASFTVNVTGINETVGNIDGVVEISINQTDVSTATTMTDVPQDFMLGQRSISDLSCSDIALNFPPPVILSTTEFKAISLTDSGSREALIAELNQANPNNGNSVNLTGKSYVIRAYVNNVNSPQPQATTLYAIACGRIEAGNSNELLPE